jgi:hypothetical protein
MDGNHAFPRFSLRTLLELIAVAAFLLYLLFGESMGNGRYQLRVDAVNGSKWMTMLDSRTGQAWSRHIHGGDWEALPKAESPEAD